MNVRLHTRQTGRQCHQLLKTQTGVFSRATKISCVCVLSPQKCSLEEENFCIQRNKAESPSHIQQRDRQHFPANICRGETADETCVTEDTTPSACRIDGGARWDHHWDPSGSSAAQNAWNRASISAEINNEDQPLNNHYISQVSGRKHSLEQTLWLSN